MSERRLAEVPPGAGASVRVELGLVQGRFGAVPLEAFALRGRDGSLRAFLNVCPHRGQPVDQGDGRLFAPDGTLECQAHGAHFDPESGLCVRGPCAGRALREVPITERDGALFLREEEPPVDDPE